MSKLGVWLEVEMEHDDILLFNLIGLHAFRGYTLRTNSYLGFLYRTFFSKRVQKNITSIAVQNIYKCVKYYST